VLQHFFDGRDMRKGARAGRMARRTSALAAAASVAVLVAACGGSSGGSGSASNGGGGTTTIEFSQWWEPELPKGSLRALMDQFEADNPKIKVKLLSGPFASTKEQTVAGAAAGTMADVVGLDGAWVSDFHKQGAITDLSTLMKDAGYDDSQLAAQIKLDGATYMIPVVNFVYPLFTNDGLLQKAGVSAPPTNRTEFMDAAKKVSALGGDVKGWALPLSLETPNGIQNDVMSWNWASGGSMLKDGKPDLTNSDVKDTVDFVKSLWDAKVVAPGGLTMKEQDKVEEFTNGRVGMMIDSLAHVTLIRDSNKDLKFSLSAIPAKDDYTGKRGIPYASWGIGIADNSDHKAEAWKLVDFLMSETSNAKLSSIANAFPGNTKAVPDFVSKDATLKAAFDIYKAGYPANEFTGLPVADELMRSFDEQLQKTLSGKQSVDELLKTSQDTWMKEF
jgi:multiple sugar transport system substrate-binding protein